MTWVYRCFCKFLISFLYIHLLLGCTSIIDNNTCIYYISVHSSTKVHPANVEQNVSPKTQASRRLHPPTLPTLYTGSTTRVQPQQPTRVEVLFYYFVTQTIYDCLICLTYLIQLTNFLCKILDDMVWPEWLNY